MWSSCAATNQALVAVNKGLNCAKELHLNVTHSRALGGRRGAIALYVFKVRFGDLGRGSWLARALGMAAQRGALRNNSLAVKIHIKSIELRLKQGLRLLLLCLFLGG